MIMLRLLTKNIKANEDNVLGGRFTMQQHRIIDLADPVNIYDAVNQCYVSSRIQALVDENTEIRSRINRLESLHQYWAVIYILRKNTLYNKNDSNRIQIYL